jgi:hypothetical protein
MKALFVVSITLLLAACAFELQAQTHSTNRVSSTLREFLNREGVRDPETGAILSVRPKTPRFFDNPPLDCSIRKLPVTNNVIRFEIVLTVLQVGGTEEHEKIVLNSEPALLVEVSRQAKYRDLAPERAQRLREARTKKIAEKASGVLRYGMSKEQVVAAKGVDWKPGTPYQKAGAFEMRYDDMTLLLDPVLVDVYPAGEPVLGDSAPKPVPLNRFDQQDLR